MATRRQRILGINNSINQDLAKKSTTSKTVTSKQVHKDRQDDSIAMPVKRGRPKKRAAAENIHQDRHSKRSPFGDITNAHKEHKQAEKTKKYIVNDTKKIAGCVKSQIRVDQLKDKSIPVALTHYQNEKANADLPNSQSNVSNSQSSDLSSFSISELSETSSTTGSQSSITLATSEISGTSESLDLNESSSTVAASSNYSSEDSQDMTRVKHSAPTDEEKRLISVKSFYMTKLKPSIAEVKPIDIDSGNKAEVRGDGAGCKRLNFVDIDAENIKDIYHAPHYAYDIFEYYKSREAKFKIDRYLTRQKVLTPLMRAILVDWLVEVQENFELNHETLYLAVKLVDLFLMIVNVSREKLQLVGAASLFISCKFDERCPPLVDDFLFICDDAYNREQFIRMEQKVFKTIGFDLGIPLSYRFLRRYAKCGMVQIDTLTLGRYILESSLMYYELTRHPDSQLAAAALHLAMKMKRIGTWSDQLIHYTGYRVHQLMPIVQELNNMLRNPLKPQTLSTIRSKYSHKVFHEVSKIPLLDPSELSS